MYIQNDENNTNRQRYTYNISLAYWKKEKNINGYIIESYARLLCKGSEQENNQKGNRQHRKVFKQLISNLH